MLKEGSIRSPRPLSCTDIKEGCTDCTEINTEKSLGRGWAENPSLTQHPGLQLEELTRDPTEAVGLESSGYPAPSQAGYSSQPGMAGIELGGDC